MNNQRIVAFVNLKRAINIMKLTVLMLTVCLSQVFAATYAQTAKLTVSAKNETLENVLKQIEKQSEFLFFYNLEEINKNEKISINKEDVNIQDLLNTISANTGLRYAIKDRHIVLYKAEVISSQQSGKKTITGIVKDVSGPIIGVNILEEGTSNGTISDMDGRFTLEVSEDAVLKFTYVGYLPQEIKITNQKSLNIVMREDSQTLDELVVVGYGSVKKSDLTGSVSSVKAEDITKIATSSPVAALQGRAAGVSVSLGSGSPDATASIQIRGVGTPNDSSPLYVVDGFPMSDINHLSPNDIESIEILKDASACAIYGSRGANGVVVITTKKGKAGDLKVNFNAYYGIEHLASKPTMLNSSQYAELSNIAYQNAGEGPLYSSTTNMPYNTDWYDTVSHLGQFQNYNISMTGGGEKVQSVFSANYYKREGIVKSTDFDRISLNQNNVFKAKIGRAHV